MPLFKEHVKFVNSKPYSKWYIIIRNKEKLGSIYLSKLNEIGIFLKEDIQGKRIGTTALKLLMIKNTAPANRTIIVTTFEAFSLNLFFDFISLAEDVFCLFF